MAAMRSLPAVVLDGRREHRKHVTRRDLLAAGRRLFGEQGLYESRIEDLTRHAGIAKGTLYGYFASKEDLIEAVVSSGFSELLGHCHRRAQSGRSRAEVVTMVVEAHFEFFAANPDLLRIFHQVRGLLKFRRPEGRPLRRVLMHYLAGLAHVLSLHGPRDRNDRRDAEIAKALFGAVSGVLSVHASLPDPESRAWRTRAVRSLVALALSFDPAVSRMTVAARPRA